MEYSECGELEGAKRVLRWIKGDPPSKRSPMGPALLVGVQVKSAIGVMAPVWDSG